MQNNLCTGYRLRGGDSTSCVSGICETVVERMGYFVLGLVLHGDG